ncbi:hypothetical protein BGW41_000991 [Actinomortierella wolfii]|nr:hypothetical protein BGW41_000991 [Actinomortierella wolfii]
MKHVHHIIRDSLIHDEFILKSAALLKFPEDKRIAVSADKHGARRLVFFIHKDYFNDWLKMHSACVGTLFTLREKPYPFSTAIKENSTQAKKDKAGQVLYRYGCHRRSRFYAPKNMIKGGKSGKTRRRPPTIRCDCRAVIKASFRPKPTSDGLPGDCYKVEYAFEHNHRLGSLDKLGTIPKSYAIRKRIEAMVGEGIPIHDIMDQLTIDHARFTCLLEGSDSKPLPGDDIVTYNDVYSILYAITAKKVKKSQKEVASAKLWMEELDKKNYFTFYDKTRGHYHGFSSPWQLDQLR